MPSIFPKNHLSKDPETCNALIGQMQLNMCGIKRTGRCSARSGLTCSRHSIFSTKTPPRPSATEKKQAARREPWRTPPLESPL